MSKLYTDAYLKIKEDLIGHKWKCPRCKKKLKITEQGVEHWGYHHGNISSLDELFEIRKWEIKQLSRLFFGDEFIKEQDIIKKI